ncbi:hypothetical protein M758_1G308800, partial [Ceratodon purpureus]
QLQTKVTCHTTPLPDLPPRTPPAPRPPGKNHSTELHQSRKRLAQAAEKREVPRRRRRVGRVAPRPSSPVRSANPVQRGWRRIHSIVATAAAPPSRLPPRRVSPLPYGTPLSALRSPIRRPPRLPSAPCWCSHIREGRILGSWGPSDGARGWRPGVRWAHRRLLGLGARWEGAAAPGPQLWRRDRKLV